VEALPGAIALPSGHLVRGRGLRRPAPPGPDPQYGLYLGSPRHHRAMPWPHRWIDWPDFRLPRDRADAVAAIRDLHAHLTAGERAEVACGGGIGRTGTVIACLAVLDGTDPADAVAWARAHYHRRAVETPWQRAWVRGFPGT
jgi:protein-tyrosine phosphatase